MMETKEVPFCSDKGDGFGAKKRARFVLEERGEIARSYFGFKLSKGIEIHLCIRNHINFRFFILQTCQ